MKHEYDSAEVDRQFDSGLDRRESHAGPMLTAGSILFDARQNGYRNAPTVARAAFRFISVGEIEYRPPEFLIDGLIEIDTLGQIFGNPGAGKTFLGVALALCVATGTPFHGRPVKKGPVLFIAGEGHNGLARRIHAWSKDQGIPLDGVQLYKSERAAHFLDHDDAAAVIAAADEVASKEPPVLIVIDTLARNFGPGDENSTADMGAFIAALDDLRARYPGSVVLLVHHSGHSEKQRARGATALKGALDFEFRVEKGGDTISLHCSKMKDAEEPAPMHFQLKTVELDGNSASAVLAPTEAPQPKRKLKSSDQTAMTVYEAAVLKHGVWDGTELKGLHVKEWRKEFYSRHTGNTPEAKRRAFNRARKSLIESGVLTARDDIYLPTDQGLLMDLASQKLERDKRDSPGQMVQCPDAEMEASAGQTGQMPIGMSGVPPSTGNVEVKSAPGRTAEERAHD